MPKTNSGYGLYQTLYPLNDSEKSLTSRQVTQLKEKIENLTPMQKEAVFMLICEHARLSDNFIFTSECSLPYGMVEDKENVVFDVKQLPPKLQWILWKFIQVVKKTKQK